MLQPIPESPHRVQGPGSPHSSLGVELSSACPPGPCTLHPSATGVWPATGRQAGARGAGLQPSGGRPAASELLHPSTDCGGQAAGVQGPGCRLQGAGSTLSSRERLFDAAAQPGGRAQGLGEGPGSRVQGLGEEVHTKGPGSRAQGLGEEVRTHRKAHTAREGGQTAQEGGQTAREGGAGGEGDQVSVLVEMESALARAEIARREAAEVHAALIAQNGKLEARLDQAAVERAGGIKQLASLARKLAVTETRHEAEMAEARRRYGLLEHTLALQEADRKAGPNLLSEVVRLREEVAILKS